MKITFPWYDAEWMNIYVMVRDFIRDNYPSKLGIFLETFEPLKTRKDFEVIRLPNFLNDEIIEASKSIIANLPAGRRETHELFDFGRLVVHNHEYFNELHKNLESTVSDLVKEEVEATYNFLSLYRSLGICEVHMDSPEAKYTVDICIEQSVDWEIFISKTQEWVEQSVFEDPDWADQIKNDPTMGFESYSLSPGSGIIFSGSSQWHYRPSIFKRNKKNFCNLIFFHFTPKGMRELLNQATWAKWFEIPEIDTLFLPESTT